MIDRKYVAMKPGVVSDQWQRNSETGRTRPPCHSREVPNRRPGTPALHTQFFYPLPTQKRSIPAPTCGPPFQRPALPEIGHLDSRVVTGNASTVPRRRRPTAGLLACIGVPVTDGLTPSFHPGRGDARSRVARERKASRSSLGGRGVGAQRSGRDVLSSFY